MAMIDSYTTVGVKEDVSDLMDLIGNTDYIFQSKLTGKGTTTQKLTEWLEDRLSPPNLNNAHAENSPFVDANFAQPVERANVTQIFHQVVAIGGSAATDSVYGRDNETARQKALAYEQMKRDVEAILLSGQTMVPTGTRKLASAQELISADFRYATGGAGVDPTFDLVKTATREAAKIGSKFTTLLIPVGDGDIPGEFIKNSNFVRQQPVTGTGAGTANDTVDFVRTPNGGLDVVMSAFINSTDWLLTKKGNYSVPFKKGRTWTMEKLAKTADGERYALYGELTLTHRNFSASAVIRRVTGTVGADGVARF